jgi:hypothetical protein
VWNALALLASQHQQLRVGREDFTYIPSEWVEEIRRRVDAAASFSMRMMVQFPPACCTLRRSGSPTGTR